MPAPSGYDVGLLHAAVNAGAAVGFFLDAAHDEPLLEEQSIVGDLAVDTRGAVSAVSYGLGTLRYRLRLQLASDALDRNHRPKTATPASLRALLLSYAAQTSGLTLQLATGDRSVLFVEAIRFISGPSVDGYVAVVALVDVT